MVVSAIIITYHRSKAVITRTSCLSRTAAVTALFYIKAVLNVEGRKALAIKGEIDDRFPDGSEVSAAEPGDPKKTYKPRDDSSRRYVEPLLLPRAQGGVSI